MSAAELIRAKHRQAAAFFERFGIDAWLISFARETGLRPDPLAYLVGASVTWPSAFLLARDGRSTAIVATGDQPTFRELGIFDEVRAYVASPREDLLAWLNEQQPKSLGVSWSASDDTADSITHGMYVYLQSLLAGTRWADGLREAGDLAAEVRRVKLPEEIAGIRRAVSACEELLARIERRLTVGISETALQHEVQEWIRSAGYGFAWDAAVNPMVNFGPVAGLGHLLPRAGKQLEPGDVIHIDIGVLVDGFASDLHRTWYCRRGGGDSAPAPVRRAFGAVVAALDAGTAALRPGARGFEVDSASRETVAEWDFPEPQFAFGHHCGRVAHDGGGVLGPRWERYGSGPEFSVGEGNVFAVEMDLEAEGYGGLVGVEEEVAVTADGLEWLSKRQTELGLLGP